MGNKILKILLCILIIVIICIGWFVYKEWNSIMAFKDALEYSQEELDSKLKQNKDDVQKYIDEKEDIIVRDLTEEESKALKEGNMSEEELIKVITGQKNILEKEPDNNSETSVKDKEPQKETNESTDSDLDKTAGQKVSEAIAKLYVQKSIYLNKLDVVEAEAKGYFANLKAQKREASGKFTKDDSQAVKKQLLTEYLPRVAAWETECDNMVYGILDEIKTALKESGGDTNIVTKLEESYLNEKKNKKAYFINRYMD